MKTGLVKVFVARKIFLPFILNMQKTHGKNPRKKSTKKIHGIRGKIPRTKSTESAEKIHGLYDPESN